MFRNYVAGFEDPVNPQVMADRALELLTSPPEAVDQLMQRWWGNGQIGHQYNGDGQPQGSRDHLIYAYLVENTRIYEIFGRALWELLHGERLGLPQNAGTFLWLRTTEELFFKDASPSQPWAIVSRLRPDLRATRRNAYFRMFGIDLLHGGEAGPYPYVRPDVANQSFRPTFEEFLRQVRTGIVNASNTSGPQPTNDYAIANLAQKLQDMLNTRRGGIGGSVLAREEFDAVATMSWLHLTLLYANPVLVDLKLTATSPDERLRMLGERVGVRAHTQSHDYLTLAPLMSQLLTLIEVGTYSAVANVPALYLRNFGGGANPVFQMMMAIINHWDRISGNRIQATGVAITPGSITPVGIDASIATPVSVSPVLVSPRSNNGASQPSAS